MTTATVLFALVLGLSAGVLSGLFGVGGGVVIVPLLILWFAFDERRATGTSLAAIVVIGALAAGVHGLYGNVDVLDGVLIGVPAVAGVLVGTAVQQRLPSRAVAGGFALLLVASAVALVF